MQTPPPSISNNYINFTGLGAAIAAFLVCRHFNAGAMPTAFALCISYAATILLLEVIFLKTYKRPSTGLDWNKRNYSARRTAIKCLGLYGTFAALGAIYYVAPEYHAVYYRPFWEAVKIVLPMVIILAAPYIAFVDAHMKEPEDGLYQCGLCFLGRWDEAKYNDVMQYALGWIVKGFFLPLMWVGIIYNIDTFLLRLFSTNIGNFGYFFSVSFNFLFVIDVFIATLGYVFTFRLFDTHIRSSDSSFLGWFVCILCYTRYIGFFQIGYSGNYNHYPWVMWFADYPVVQIIWGSAILISSSLYVLSTFAFGCRFSNLTHRGIITNGMFRFTKHPAYVCKNINWWLLSAPFFPIENKAIALSYTFLLLAENGVYLLRARTEEHHLSYDPNYVAYAVYMNEHSIFKHFGQLFPWLKYSPPRV